jgi:hypothetical protein
VATIKLTEKSVATLKAPTASGKQELSWDTDLKGFGVLCSGITNTKTFVAQAALATGLRRRVTIGRCDRVKVAEARDKAREVLAKMDLGEDPKAKANKLTLKQALDAYINPDCPSASKRGLMMQVGSSSPPRQCRLGAQGSPRTKTRAGQRPELASTAYMGKAAWAKGSCRQPPRRRLLPITALLGSYRRPQTKMGSGFLLRGLQVRILLGSPIKSGTCRNTLALFHVAFCPRRSPLVSMSYNVLR